MTESADQTILFHRVKKLREIASQRDGTLGQPDMGRLKKARKCCHRKKEYYNNGEALFYCLHQTRG